MNNHIRRLQVGMNTSVAWFTDTLHLLPPDTVVVDAALDISRHAWVLYVVNPEFAEVEPGAEIPEFQMRTEVFRGLFGGSHVRPMGLVDPVSGKEYHPE